LGLAVIGNLIYAVGGRDANGCLNTVECFVSLKLIKQVLYFFINLKKKLKVYFD